jgi:hypothetical protein
MGLLDMLSGRAARENKISGIVSTEPMERLRSQIPVTGLLEHYSVALALVVDETVKDIVGEKAPIPEFAEIGKHVKREPIERLAAYLAARSCDLLVSRYPGIFQDANGEVDDVGRQMIRDFYLVTETMYPSSDPIVTTAIKNFRSGTMPTDPGGSPDSHRYLSEQNDDFNSLLGVVPAGDPMNEIIALGAVLTLLPKHLKEMLDMIMSESHGRR